MKVRHYSDIEPSEEIKGVSRRDVHTAEDGATVALMQIFELVPHASTPSHLHAWEHEVFVIAGKGLAIGNEGSIQIRDGSIIFIPANESHTFVNTSGESLKYICVEPLKKA